ncbi:hypothetical protein V6N13_127323 [Hibiscus sabdariffa]|uniref:Uncharacterized protein n=1 Tax=Hibiscus sabdariffa TaxID=183260 RepID=A0ABR2RD65_9ROSI
MVSDGFLWWTLESATKFGFPRLVFTGMNTFSSSISKAIAEDRLLVRTESDDELLTVTQFPWIKVTRSDFSSIPGPNDPSRELFMELAETMSNSCQGCSVLYVAFGSQAEISPEQLQKIAIGLQESKANFLWVLKEKESESMDVEGFEERVSGRGIVGKQWVDQRQILKHRCVQGFLSHCGWKAYVTESHLHGRC